MLTIHIILVFKDVGEEIVDDDSDDESLASYDQPSDEEIGMLNHFVFIS